MRTRAEHIAFCKDRAFEYLAEGDVTNAVTSLISDLSKHPECAVNAALVQLGMLYIMNHDIAGARRFIDGFN